MPCGWPGPEGVKAASWPSAPLNLPDLLSFLLLFYILSRLLILRCLWLPCHASSCDWTWRLGIFSCFSWQQGLSNLPRPNGLGFGPLKRACPFGCLTLACGGVVFWAQTLVAMQEYEVDIVICPGHVPGGGRRQPTPGQTKPYWHDLTL